jgi:hypothetical protein
VLVRPSGVSELLRQLQRFAPRSLCAHRIEIFIHLALDREASQSQAVVRVDQWIVEVSRKIPSPRPGGAAIVRRWRRPEARPLADVSDFHPTEVSDFGVVGQFENPPA